MADYLQLERSRLLGFRLLAGESVSVSVDPRITAEIGSPFAGESNDEPPAGLFDPRIGAKIGKPSDVRLKRDISLVGRVGEALGLYRYRYLWSDTVYVGVMAQEVALVHPEAIVRSAFDKYLRVDYSRLGLKLMTWAEWQGRGAKL
jgi:endosialidase-like protein